MNIKFLLFILFFVFFTSNVVLATLPNSEVIFYGKKSFPPRKSCPVCSSGTKKLAHSSSNISMTMRYAEQLNTREKQFYCDATKKAIADISQALSSDIESDDNVIFSTNAEGIAKYFSLTLPSVVSYDKRRVVTSDFSYEFFSDGECELVGFCFIKVDLNKDSKPNLSHHDSIYVNLLFNGRKINLEYDPAGIYRRIMCGE